MHLILHNNRFYSWALSYSQYMRYAATMFLTSFIVGVWYCYLYNPLLIKQKRLQEELTAIQKECQKHSHLAHEQEKMSLLIESLNHDYNQVHNAYKKMNLLQNNATDLLKKFIKNNILLLGSCSKKKNKKEWYAKKEVLYNLEGTFNDMISFLILLKKETKLIQCKKISLEKSGKNALKIQCSLDFISLCKA